MPEPEPPAAAATDPVAAGPADAAGAVTDPATTDPAGPGGSVTVRERRAALSAGLRADITAALTGPDRTAVGVQVGRFILQKLRENGTGPTRSELAAHLNPAGRFPPPHDLPPPWHRWWEMTAINTTLGVLRRHGYLTYTRTPRSLRTGPAFYPAAKTTTKPPDGPPPPDGPGGAGPATPGPTG